jgi:hypothetical protein
VAATASLQRAVGLNVRKLLGASVALLNLNVLNSLPNSLTKPPDSATTDDPTAVLPLSAIKVYKPRHFVLVSAQALSTLCSLSLSFFSLFFIRSCGRASTPVCIEEEAAGVAEKE